VHKEASAINVEGVAHAQEKFPCFIEGHAHIS
jgi:hypothetical protein